MATMSKYGKKSGVDKYVSIGSQVYFFYLDHHDLSPRSFIKGERKQVWLLNSITPNKINRVSTRHFQLNPILIWEFDMVVRIIFLRDIVKDNM